MKNNNDVMHTLTPWHLQPYGEKLEHPSIAGGPLSLTIADLAVVGFPANESHANAAFIVRAVNAHEDLLNGLKDVLNFIRDDRQCKSKRCGHYSSSDCIDTYIADKIAKTERK